MSEEHGFYVFGLEPSAEPEAMFEELSACVDFEHVTGGRVGNHLTRPCERGVPIVRTTTRYARPAHVFSRAQAELADRICDVAQGLPLPAVRFNHALIEVYDQRYTKMGYHSDQRLDLDEESLIAIFSCYDRAGPSSGPSPERGVRQLMVKSKHDDTRFSLPMPHGSVVLFSVATNARYLHKIVLPSPAPEATRWLGLTLRCSKTFVRYEAGAAELPDGRVLTLADEQQRANFYRLRGRENRASEFCYPELSYTISEGDLLPPQVAASAE